MVHCYLKCQHIVRVQHNTISDSRTTAWYRCRSQVHLPSGTSGIKQRKRTSLTNDLAVSKHQLSKSSGKLAQASNNAMISCSILDTWRNNTDVLAMKRALIIPQSFGDLHKPPTALFGYTPLSSRRPRTLSDANSYSVLQ